MGNYMIAHLQYTFIVFKSGLSLTTQQRDAITAKGWTIVWA